MSDDTQHAIDEEIRHFIDRNYERAEQILQEHMDKLHMMADALLKYETIDSRQIDAIMEGREPPPPADWDDDQQPPSGREQESGQQPAAGEAGTQGGTIGGPASQH
jgi:cell division protease FtsH